MVIIESSPDTDTTPSHHFTTISQVINRAPYITVNSFSVVAITVVIVVAVVIAAVVNGRIVIATINRCCSLVVTIIIVIVVFVPVAVVASRVDVIVGCELEV